MKQITLVGASARAAAESATRGGLWPLAFDLFGDEDTRAAGVWHPLRSLPRYRPQVAASDIVLLGGIESRPEIHRMLRALGPAPPLRFPWFRDRCTWLHQMAQLVRGTPVRWPETRRSRPADRRGWLGKALDSAGGLAVVPAAQALGRPRGQTVWQRYLAGQSMSSALLLAEDRIVWLGAAVALAASAAASISPFCYGGSLRLEQPPQHVIDGSLALARRLQRQYGVRGLVGFDFIAQPGALWLLEINARYTASMELHEPLDGSLVAAHLDAIHRVPFEVAEPTELRGKKIVYARSDVVVDQRLELPTGVAIGGEGAPVAVTVHDRPQTGTCIRRAAPLCTLIARGATSEEIVAALQAAEDEIVPQLSESRAVDAAGP